MNSGRLSVILLKHEQVWAIVDERRKVVVIEGERQVFKKRRDAHVMLDYLSPQIKIEEQVEENAVRTFSYQP